MFDNCANPLYIRNRSISDGWLLNGAKGRSGSW
jgi:hypothetical protein